MSDHTTHDPHDHVHAPGCGHQPIRHDDHVDYLHDGHLHHPHDGHVDEHALAIGRSNPGGCMPHACGGHVYWHAHAPGCGHAAVPHGDHVDYLVGGHLHHQHGDHCDDHGPIELA